MDKSPHFLKPSNEPMEFDVFTKSKAPGFIPLAPVTKSMWTCSVEAVLEFARIIYDIYPTDKLVSTIFDSNSVSWKELINQLLVYNIEL